MQSTQRFAGRFAGLVARWLMVAAVLIGGRALAAEEVHPASKEGKKEGKEVTPAPPAGEPSSVSTEISYVQVGLEEEDDLFAPIVRGE